MFSLYFFKQSFFIFLNKKILFSQKFFYLKNLFIISNIKVTWFLKIQKNLYHFGLITPFNK